MTKGIWLGEKQLDFNMAQHPYIPLYVADMTLDCVMTFMIWLYDLQLVA